MPAHYPSTTLKFTSGLSDHHDAVTAAEQACDRALEGFFGAGTESRAPSRERAARDSGPVIGVGAEASAASAAAQAERVLGSGDPDLAIAFVSHHHADLMGAIGDVLHRRLNPGTLLAVSAEAVIGDMPGAATAEGGAAAARTPVELEGKPGISILAARFPVASAGGAGAGAITGLSGSLTPGTIIPTTSGVTVRAFTSEDLPFLEEGDPMIGDKIAAAIGATPDLRAILLFADPFSVPVVRLLPAISRMCRDTLGLPRAPIIGGMASAGDKPGSNGLVINKRLSRTGAIGLTISGDIRVDTLVSQGCKPFGPTYVVTGGKHNVLLSLSGRPALQALHEAIETIPPEDRNQLEKGVFLGRVVNEYKDRFGRDDFLIRNVLGVDQSRKALAVADMLRVGQTVRFHLRDAVAADEDLSLLLAAQRLKSPALGALLFTCNGRGTRLFEQPNHDIGLVAAALTPEAPPGVPGAPGASPPPIAGFFAAGEIGPVGGEAFLHGQTASMAVFRERFADDPEV